MVCADCGFEAKSAAGLSSHRRWKHRRGAGSNVAAVEETLGELERLGRLELIDSAQVQAVRSIAEALDEHPFNSQMWREYREALSVLTKADDVVDDDFERAIAELRSSTPVGDTKET